MCGITGIYQPQPQLNNDQLTQAVSQMNETLLHRGPDYGGLWADAEVGVALAMRRLAIVDLSPAGQQPMRSASGRLTIVFNGEIYNHLELRRALDAEAGRQWAWRGHSDTEILLNAIECWGMQVALSKAVGMFAFAVWDSQHDQLTLGRDRMGEKPLYYGWAGNMFVFGSELKALRRSPNWHASISKHALSLYMRHGYIPQPHTIYEGIYKLPAGSTLTLSPSAQAGTLPSPQPYWQLQRVLEHGQRNPFKGSADDAQAQLEQLLRQAVAGQMIADVPLGAFLSGGVDSSLIAALMQAQSERPIRTFTVGFGEHAFDESQHARAVAEHLHTDHTELRVSEQDALAVVPHLPQIYDEPFADSSQIPTYLISKLTRQYVTVSLSGDAGDELFAGYTRYQTALNVWANLQRVPRLLQPVEGAAMGIVSNLLVSPLLGRFHRMGRMTQYTQAQSLDVLYGQMVSLWQTPETIIKGGDPANLIFDQSRQLASIISNPHERMMALDMQTYLPDDILVKVDRAAMAASLETRVPFLDHRLIEFVATLPLTMKANAGQTKWLLRQILYRHVPKTLIERPKQGFAVPLAAWLRGGLRDWADELLALPKLDAQGYFNAPIIAQMWAEHRSGKRDWQYYLWSVLMFQAWCVASKCQ